MRSLVVLCLIGILISASFAQSAPRPACPTVSVLGPPGVPKPGKPVPFEATVKGEVDGLDLRFLWTAKDGAIATGQGTSKVGVYWPDWCFSLLVTVQVTGLPAGCPSTASEVAGVSHCRPTEAVLIDEFVGPLSKITTARMDKIGLAVAKDPLARLYVVISGKPRSPRSYIRSKRAVLAKKLAHSRGPDSYRVVYVDSDKGDDRIKLWLVPAGARDPEP